MFATGYQSYSVKLELDSLEAKWLKNIMQNPLHDQSYGEESKLNRVMREKFFNALKEAGVEE